MPWRPTEPGERPSLGWYVLDWIAENLAAPDREVYEPFAPTAEQAAFILAFYELHPRTCRRLVRRGVLSRPRGWGKSPFVASLAIAEGLADVVPDGWDAFGQPVGKPWVSVRTPKIRVAASTEAQVGNCWSALLEMLSEQAPALANYPGLEPLDTFVNLPKGKIIPTTSSTTAVKGSRDVFSLLDQTEQWTSSNGGIRLYDVMRSNSAKVGGSFIESPNAYTSGDGSVAERTANAWRAILEGRARREPGLLYDHREAPAATELDERASLVAGLRYSYGDSSDHPDGCVLHDPACAPGWVPIENLVSTIWEPDFDAQQARADFLNQITHAADAWLSGPEWSSCRDSGKVVTADGEPVVLGFDGSRGRSKGKPDATALIGCRVADGHLFQLGVWEAGDNPDSWGRWSPPIAEIEALLAETFRMRNVVGFYADPGKDWRSHVNAWEAKFQTPLKATREHPFEWWMTGGRSGLVQIAIEQLEGAVLNRDCSHDGSAALTRHVLNARRRLSHGKLGLGKESDYSSKKIDAAVAAVLAWQCRLDAVAKGLAKKTNGVSRPKRIY